MRLFISVELPDQVKKQIADLVTELKQVGAEIKWAEPENLHITLLFLGEVADSRRDNLITLSAKAVSGQTSFRANFSGLGTFPEGSNPRVVWVGTAAGGAELKVLADSLAETLSRAGFPGADKEFKPHITIGRIKSRKGMDILKQKMAAIKVVSFGEAVIDRVCLMKSTLTPKGPVYNKIKEVKL
jgi:2'-5' RNA ligase